MRDLIRTAREHIRFVILRQQHLAGAAHRRALRRRSGLPDHVQSSPLDVHEPGRDGIAGEQGQTRSGQVQVVLNRYRNDTSWDLPTIEAYMDIPVFGLIPASQKDALTEADNTGRPFVAAHMGRNDADDERVLKAFINLAGAVCEPVRTLAAERERKQRGLLGRIGKKP